MSYTSSVLMCNRVAGAKKDEVNRKAEGQMPRDVGQCLDKVPLLRRGDGAPTLLTDCKNQSIKCMTITIFKYS
jgi:hypothetical protein